jgi:glycosyltransferase involved in cell wall biosynthesis
MAVRDTWAQLGRRVVGRIVHPQPGIRHPKRYRSSDQGSALYTLLSANPPIFYVAHWMDEQLVFLASLDMLFEYLRNRPAYFLYAWYWHIEDPQRVEIVRQFETEHRRRYPKHRFIHCCNTTRQQEVFQQAKLDAVLCNHNCLVDENIFRPLASVPRTYDAVYDARLKSYKRHELATKIRNLALIYDFDPAIDDPLYVDMVRREFAHAHFFNHRDPSGYSKLSVTEVNDCLNQCRVGLCLSEVEGAMYASVQYLLSGLPVVSTKSRGGRDVFFDEDYVKIVEDNPDAVAEGVEELIGRCIPADWIRQKTLDKLRDHRLTLMSLVQSIYDAERVERDFAAEWDTIFFDKLVSYQSHADTIACLEAAN